jgi:hypothetical protein
MSNLTISSVIFIGILSDDEAANKCCPKTLKYTSGVDHVTAVGWRVESASWRPAPGTISPSNLTTPTLNLGGRGSLLTF